MTNSLKFSHKILLAASLVVIATFALFTLYNDYLQRNAIRANLESYLDEMGEVTAHNIQNWLSGRILLVESAAQSIGSDSAEARVATLLEQKALASTFMFSYLGGQDGSFLMRPAEEMPADYDPRARPWYKDAIAAGGSTLTEPYVDAASGELVISIATPAQQSGRNIGVVGGDLGLKALVEIINALDFNGMGFINEDYAKNPDYYNSLTAVQEGKVYSQISFRSNASNLETALADAYYAACIIYPEQFQDVDPIAKAEEIFEMLLGVNPYDELKEAGYELRAIKIGQ